MAVPARRGPAPLHDALSAEYIAWCQAEGIPENTLRRSRSVLRSVGNAGQATRSEVEDWWAEHRRLAPTSRANALAVLRSFYRWAQIWEHRLDDPTVRIRPPKIGRGRPAPVVDVEWHRLRDNLTPDTDVWRAVHLGAWGGLRIEEAAALDWADVDVTSRTARVTGKGSKVRNVKLSKALLAELGKPMRSGNVVTRGLPLTAGWLGSKCNAAMRTAGVDRTFHKLRHRYGTKAYRLTKDPKALAEQMGHGSPATTLIFYADADDDAADAIADAVSS